MKRDTNHKSQITNHIVEDWKSAVGKEALQNHKLHKQHTSWQEQSVLVANVWDTLGILLNVNGQAYVDCTVC
jgi:hypothetical protein